MKKYSKSVLLVAYILVLNYGFAQDSRLELGAYENGNNWLIYPPANSSYINLAVPRNNYEEDATIWSYQWSSGLQYTTGGSLLTGAHYGFRDTEGLIGYKNSGQSKIEFYYSGNPSNSGKLILSYGTATSSSMMFGTNTSDGYENLMTLKKSNDLALLIIKGNVHSREVKVSVDAGADFVFDESYKLKTLEETEDFITQNKHLPEMASESEMLKNGLEIGEMNIKLLQKIEELTLYLIEQDKQNQAQQQRIEKLEQELSSIKKQ